jgi:hypothetical protein
MTLLEKVAPKQKPREALFYELSFINYAITMMVCTTFFPRRDDELLLKKSNHNCHSIMLHLTDVSTDCNNKFHTFLRNVSEWTFCGDKDKKLDRRNGVKLVGSTEIEKFVIS